MNASVYLSVFTHGSIAVLCTNSLTHTSPFRGCCSFLLLLPFFLPLFLRRRRHLSLARCICVNECCVVVCLCVYRIGNVEKGVTTFSWYKILIQLKKHRILLWTFAQRPCELEKATTSNTEQNFRDQHFFRRKFHFPLGLPYEQRQQLQIDQCIVFVNLNFEAFFSLVF